MKKVLFATTALVASAGIASADVAVSGFAELGILDDGAETQFHTDIDVTFTMSGETDGGLTFGASIDLDESDGDPSGAFDADTQGGESIFVSGGFGTLTMGDTDGAFDAAMTEAIIGGAINDDHEHAGYNGNAGFDGLGKDGQIARYDYSFGDLGLHISAEIDDAGVDDPTLGLAVTYSTDLGGVDLGLGLAYQSAEVSIASGTTVGAIVATSDLVVEADIIGLSVSADFAGGFSAIANYSTVSADVNGADSGVDPTHFGLALGYTMDALTVAVNYGEYDEWVLRAAPDSEGFGLVVNYDLGGGAEAQFGYGSNDTGSAADEDTFSLGLALSF